MQFRPMPTPTRCPCSSSEQVADLKVHTLLCARVDDYAYWRCLLQPESANYALADPQSATVEEAYARSSAPRSSVCTEMRQQCSGRWEDIPPLYGVRRENRVYSLKKQL
jgi:hypothetical protein